MSRNNPYGLDAILTLPLQSSKINIANIAQIWTRLERLYQTKTDHTDCSTILWLLPFSNTINNCICRTLQDTNGHLNWRFCLAAIALLVNDTISNKIQFLHKLYERESTNPLSRKRLLKDALRCAQRIAISVNIEAGDKTSYKYGNIGSAKYHEEESIDLLVESILAVYAECESNICLKRPFRVNWTSIAAEPLYPSPVSRSKHASCLCGHKIYILGGRDGRYPVNDFWSYDLVTESWVKLHPTGDTPPLLEEHTMITSGEKIFVFGGVCRMSVDGETPLWIFDTAKNSWKHWKSESEVMLPPCVKGHTAVLVEKDMCIFGGYEDILGSSELMWSFNIVDEQWHLVYSLPLKGAGPSPRHHHTATLHDNKMIIIGGVNNLHPVTDMWMWNLRDKNWSKIKPISNTPTIYNHTAIKLSQSIYVYGGQDHLGSSKYVWEYKIDSGMWKCKSMGLGGAPPPRSYHTAVVVLSTMFTSQPITERTRSVPAISTATLRVEDRPQTSLSANSNPPFIASNKVYPLVKQQNTPLSSLLKRNVTTLNDIPRAKLCYEENLHDLQDTNNNASCYKSEVTYLRQKRTIDKSHSDYEIIPYLRSYSRDKLIEQSRAISDSSFTFDNPAYLNSSNDELSTRVSVNAPTIPCGDTRTLGYGKLSRSLDSIQDIAHDSRVEYAASLATLPGTVITEYEGRNETCTIQNIVLEDRSQTWEDVTDEESAHTEEDFSLPLTQNSAHSVPFKVFIIGGQEKKVSGASAAQSICMWRADISSTSATGRNKVNKQDDGCVVS